MRLGLTAVIAGRWIWLSIVVTRLLWRFYLLLLPSQARDALTGADDMSLATAGSEVHRRE